MSRGYCGIGVVHSKAHQNVGTLWRSAHAFGAAFIFTLARRYDHQHSDVWKSPRHVPLLHFPTLDDLRHHLPFGCKLVGVELVAGATLLPEYKHPPCACYLLGAEDDGLPREALAACHEVVAIPGASACLNVATAGSIVLYDRATRGVTR